MGGNWSIGREAELAGRRELVYGVLSDTNRWNRLTGASPTSYTYELLDPGDPTSRTRIGHAKLMGLPLRFAEEGEYWSGLRFHGERRFTGGMGRLFRCAALDVEIEDATGGDAPRSRVRIRCGVEINGALGYLVAPLALLRVWIALRLYLRAARRVLEEASAHAGGEIGAGAPGAAIARRALLATNVDQRGIGGAVTQTLREALRSRTARFARSPVSSELQRRIVDFVIQQPDDALVQVRPFEVARVWGEPRRTVLRAFLHATRAGLFDLDWQVNCPTCRVGTDVATDLASLSERVHCDECAISFDVDFSENVEATFTVSPSIRAAPRVVYCASSPYFIPHIHGYIAIAPGKTRAIGPLPDGALLLRARGTPRVLVVPDGDRDGAPVSVRITDDAIERTADTAGADAVDGVEPRATLTVANATGRTVRLIVERAGWDAEIARGSLLMTMPDFIELFGTEAPAAGHQLEVGTYAVLFTDVVGSTELYEQLGDARAFALMQEHWRDAARIVGGRDGAVIKTMGDGLMCCFTGVGNAVTAALAIIDETARLSLRHGVQFTVRTGVHEGPCYAVRANDRLDLFGGTVNTAARLMNAAAGRQIAMLASTLAHPVLHARLADEHAVQRTARVELRGLRGVHDVALVWRSDAEAFSTGEHMPVARLISSKVE